MKVRELTALIEELAPLRYAEAWDNPGLMTGDPEAEVRHVFIGFDVDLQTVAEAAEAGADFLLTHHPLFFKPVNNLTEDRLAGKKLALLIKNGIAAYGAHTSFDAAPGCMAELCARRLGLSAEAFMEPIEDGGIGTVGELPEALTAEALAELIKERFGLPAVQLYSRGGGERLIRRAAILPGAGGSEWEEALALGAEAYITGDVSHHAALDAMDMGLTVIDAGHYGLEWLFLEKAEAYLRERLPKDIRLSVQQKRLPGRIL